MNTLLQMISRVDLSVYTLLNARAGNYFLDHFMAFAESNHLFKGGVFLALYWYLWFRADAQQDWRRMTIIKILAGSLLALIASRAVADLAPFRIRPMYGVPSRPFSFPVSPDMENWSSFPSDTAAYFSALAYGLSQLARRWAAPLLLYTAVWICLPRLFLGAHYVSDVVVGAALGIAMVWASLRSDWLLSGFAARLLKFRALKPHAFYAAAFLVSFEMSVLFDDIRGAARSFYHAAGAVGYRDLSHSTVSHSFSILGIAIVVVYTLFWVLKRWQSARSERNSQ